MIDAKQMADAGFTFDRCGWSGLARWTNDAHQITAVRQPFMNDERWQTEMAWALRKREISLQNTTLETPGEQK